MEMLQILEADKERILSELAKAGVPEKVQPVLDKTFDRMLLQYNEECDEERVRDAAKHMLQTAKALVPLVDTAGDAKVWSSDRGAGASQAGVKMTVPAIVCLIGGILFLAGAVLGLAVSAGQYALPCRARRQSLQLYNAPGETMPDTKSPCASRRTKTHESLMRMGIISHAIRLPLQGREWRV